MDEHMPEARETIRVPDHRRSPSSPPPSRSMTVPRPEKALDLPCPWASCQAAIGVMCWKEPLIERELTGVHAHTTQVHRVRKQRLGQAQLDWDRLQEWVKSVNGGPP
jgi:hypothetical protein